MTTSLSITALKAFPPVIPGDCLATIIMESLNQNDIILQDQDILVLAQKIVSKAENRYARLSDYTPGKEAQTLSAQTGHDPRLTEAILQESGSVVRAAPGVLITRHKRGYVMANAGIDRSNIDGDNDTILLLPIDPDQSAQTLRKQVAQETGASVAVLINDSFGRPFRIGTSGVVLGSSGLLALRDHRGGTDLRGRTLQTTQIAVGDELAAAASLVMGGTDEGRPVVHIRGWNCENTDSGALSLIRPEEEDLFR